MLALVLGAVLWRAPAPIVLPGGAAHQAALAAPPGPARLVLRARLPHWRPAGSTYALRLRLDDLVLGPMRDRRTPRLVGETPVAGDLPAYRFGLWRVPYAPEPGARELVLDVPELDRPRVLHVEHVGTPGTTLEIANLRLEAALDRPAGIPPPAPDWRRPRLGRPVAPAFTASATAGSVDVTWDGVTATVRTTAIGGAHRWERTIVPHATHVEVRDTITNPGAEPIGLRIRHALATDATWIHLAGDPDPSHAVIYAPWNPTAFTPVGTRGLGLVAEDDVLRQQLTVDADAVSGTIGLRTDMFCLAGGTHTTLVWSLYPTRTNDYWDFVNTVRTDWGVNKTIPGSFIWFTPDAILGLPEERLRAALARQGVGIASSSGGWVDPQDTTRPPHIGFGTAVAGPTFAGYRTRLQAAIARLHALRPEVRVLVYVDTERESVPDAPARFADSLLRPLRRTDWGGRFQPSWEMVATSDTSFGRALPDAFDVVAALGADGLYWDEMSGIDYDTPRTTDAVWDGHTCRLDAAGAIEARVGLANLLSAAVKASLAGERLVLGNSPPTTRRFQQRPDLRMVEGHHGPGWATYAHLSDPLGYVGMERTDFAMMCEMLAEPLLPAHTRLDYAYDLPARLFPLTPEYLQPGTVRGRERIATCTSGTHGWVGATGAVVARRFDATGREHAANWHVKLRRGLFVRVRLAPGELAVLERHDAS